VPHGAKKHRCRRLCIGIVVSAFVHGAVLFIWEPSLPNEKAQRRASTLAVTLRKPPVQSTVENSKVRSYYHQ